MWYKLVEECVAGTTLGPIAFLQKTKIHKINVISGPGLSLKQLTQRWCCTDTFYTQSSPLYLATLTSIILEVVRPIRARDPHNRIKTRVLMTILIPQTSSQSTHVLRPRRLLRSCSARSACNKVRSIIYWYNSCSKSDWSIRCHLKRVFRNIATPFTGLSILKIIFLSFCRLS